MGVLKKIGDAATGGIISAGGAIVGGVLMSRAQNRATDASLEANREAIAFSREQDERGTAAYEERMQIWQASRQALLDKYGIDIAPPTMGGPGGPGGAPQGAPQAPPPGAVPRGAPGPQGMAPGVADAKGLSGRSLGELASMGKGKGSWNDWSTMGLRGGGNA